MLTPIDASLVPEELSDLVPKLATGWAGAFRIDGTEAAIIVSIGLTKDSDEIAIWVEGLAGEVGFRPHDNYRLMRDVLDECGLIGRQLNCTEMRIEANSRTHWKDRLLPALGFKPVQIGGGMVYRRVLTDG